MRKTIRHLTPFRAGLLAGVAVGLVIVVALNLRPTEEGPTAEIASSGATLSAAGVRRLELVTNGPAIVKQICAGACDDLTFTSRMGSGSGFLVRLWRKDGRCIACDQEVRVEGPAGSVTRLDIGAPSAPLLQTSYYRVNPDGSRTPTSPPAQ